MPFFLPALKRNNYLDSLHITLCNVGSRKVQQQVDTCSSDIWGIFAPNLTIIGFDADTEACEIANAEYEASGATWNEFHIPIALAKEVGTSTLYLTKNRMCSSLYAPNQELLKHYPRLPDLVGLEDTMLVETTTLDAFCQAEDVEEIDFLKIDVQGAELQVLEGSIELLQRSVLAVQVEVEFSPIYQNQPLFADVDAFLRRLGFVLFDFSPLAHEQRSYLSSNSRSGQLLWSDALYFRDPFHANTPESLRDSAHMLKLACIADALEFTDFALELLEHITLESDRASSYNLADSIIESLAQLPQLVQVGLETIPNVVKLKDYLTKSIEELVAIATSNQSAAFAPPVQAFHSGHYLRHNQRRQEHLASLGLDLVGTSVLEVGAGIGDHTSFFLDRGCSVVSTEGRSDNFEILRQRYPNLEVRLLDLDQPDSNWSQNFDVIYCYGLLYHLCQPAIAIDFMAKHCQKYLLLETAVSPGQDELINLKAEPAASPTQSIAGQGCRPTRTWIYNQLKQHFPFVYLPITQPNHEEFPIDWTADLSQAEYVRSVFIASRVPLKNPLLVEGIPMQQKRH